MKLNEIRDNEGARKKRMIIGRGIGSGKGKTGGRGVKGQKARTGVRLKNFEGGQMPMIRRMPKRGFNNIFAADFTVINLGVLQAAIDAGRIAKGADITEKMLTDARVCSRGRDGVKLLGKGTLSAKINLTITQASPSAVAAVEKAGGKVTTTYVAPQKGPRKMAKKADRQKA